VQWTLFFRLTWYVFYCFDSNIATYSYHTRPKLYLSPSAWQMSSVNMLSCYSAGHAGSPKKSAHCIQPSGPLYSTGLSRKLVHHGHKTALSWYRIRSHLVYGIYTAVFIGENGLRHTVETKGGRANVETKERVELTSLLRSLPRCMGHGIYKDM